MAAGLGALGNDNVRSGLLGFASLSYRLHLADQERARCVYGGGKGARVAKRKHDRGRSVRKGAVQYLWVLGEAPCDVFKRPWSQSRYGG